jgi:stage II sporulation protein AA (anti-sigma F factor antagonist)
MSTGSQPPEPQSAVFSCEVRADPGSVRVLPVGDLDMASAPALEARLAQVWDSGARNLVLDLSRLRFMDSTGLRLILAWDARCREDGCAIRLVPGPRAVQRVFEVTGMLQRLSFLERPADSLE